MNYSVYESTRTISRRRISVWRQGFPVLLCALSALGYMLAGHFPVTALLVAVISLVDVFMISGWEKVALYFTKSAERPASPYRSLIAFHPVQDQQYTIVFAAKYSPFSRLFSPSVSKFISLGIVISSILGSALLSATVFTGLPREWMLPTLGLLFAFTVAQQFNKQATSEAIRRKNASAPALLLEIAHSFAGSDPNANLVFITGESPEYPGCDATAILDDPEFQTTFPPERTTIIHIEQSGTGDKVRISNRFGIPPVNTGILFTRLIRDIAARFGIESRESWSHLGSESPAAQAYIRGYQSVGLSTYATRKRSKKRTSQASSHEFLFAIAQEIVDSIPRIRPYNADNL